MALAARPTQAIRRATQKQSRFPMPTGGLNYIDGPMSFPEADAYLIDNLIARSYGSELRKGWKYWIPIANKFGGEIRSVMAYNSSVPGDEKLYCSPSSDGHIYDITTPNAAPTSVLTPSPASTVLGEWYSAMYIVPGGAYLCAVSKGAGYYNYKTGAGWVKVTLTFPGGDSTTTEDLAFLFVWKNRLWFLKYNSTVAYYLPLQSISGTLTAFDFGPQLLRGGYLSFGTSWTYDSGSGIDDGLVICSSKGDMLLYRGSDPASAATFGMQGLWYCGRLPVGRRGFCQHGGNVLILTEYGVVNIADLVAGRIHTAQISGEIGRKVNPRLSRLITQYFNDKYWSLVPYPTEELLILCTPVFNEVLGIRLSYFMSSLTNTWNSVSSIDILSAVMFNGQFIFGTRDGFVCLGFSGTRDGDSYDSVTLGDDVTGRLQCAFNDMGSPTMNKRLLRTKLYGFSESIPSFAVTFKEEYDLNELISVNAPAPVSASLWDAAIWDLSYWDTSIRSFRRWIGVAAVGKKLSLQLAVRGAGGTILTDYEVLYEEGINL